jgi:hypothetical protein
MNTYALISPHHAHGVQVQFALLYACKKRFCGTFIALYVSVFNWFGY